MITLFHGTDTALSRKTFLDIKNSKTAAILIDGGTITLTDFVQVFEGGELFTDRKEFFIEELFLKRKKSKELDAIIEYLRKQEANHKIFLWEPSVLGKTILGKFKNPTIREFKIPQTIFAFLEGLRPGNTKQMLNLFHQTTETADVEMVFFMIVRQVRILLGLSHPTSDGIDEIKKLGSWQKDKFQSQASYFDVDKLKKIYSDLFEIETRLKTGNLALNLTQTIDLILLSI